MSNVNIRRAVENIRSGTTIYTPPIELIVNAIQAIRAVKQNGGLIEVTVLRSDQLEMEDRLAAVTGFIVRDDGMGFTQLHRDSFDTLYTEVKASDGGKGFGRFTCLKYFDSLIVESIFDDDSGPKRRSFAMGTGTDIIIDEQVSEAPGEKIGTSVTISGMRDIRFSDKGLDTIARILVEKLLPYLIDATFVCPTIVLRETDDSAKIVLNDYLSHENRQIVELSLPTSQIELGQSERSTFDVRVFKFYFPRMNKSKISLVAHHREVTDVTIQTYIPEFSDEFYDKGAEPGERDRNYIIKAYVFGKYLDENVSLERGAFNFPKESDLTGVIAQSHIEKATAELAQTAIGEEILARRDRKRERIQQYVREEAPWHRELSEQVDFSALTMNPRPQDIELLLQTAKFQREVQTRAEVRRVLEDGPDSLIDKVAELVESISQTSKNDLIHYVSMRKCVLDLFAKSLEIGESGKYRSEGEVHDVIVTRRKDSTTLSYEDHNLWILDERLNFAEYVSSDKPLNGGHSGRADIAVFGRRVAFRGENFASNPITIFEFKKPQRDDFVDPSSEEDPVQQIIRYVNDLRDGKYKTPAGRDFLISENTPFYGYVVCDLTKKVKGWLEREKNFTVMPDDVTPVMPPFMGRVCSGYGPQWGVLQTPSV